MEAIAAGDLPYVTCDELIRDLHKAGQLGSLRNELVHFQRTASVSTPPRSGAFRSSAQTATASEGKPTSRA
jgi:hypothetical protein